MRINKKGFTLIELLVVISIIAIIAGVVLANLNDARKKANDTKVKEQLDSVRKNAALYYSTHGDYGIPYANCFRLGGGEAPFFADTESGMSTVTNEAVYPAGTMLTCGTNGQAYMMTATISNDKGWCVDSTGASKEIVDVQSYTGAKFSCDSGGPSSF